MRLRTIVAATTILVPGFAAAEVPLPAMGQAPLSGLYIGAGVGLNWHAGRHRRTSPLEEPLWVVFARLCCRSDRSRASEGCGAPNRDQAAAGFGGDHVADRRADARSCGVLRPDGWREVMGPTDRKPRIGYFDPK